MSIRTATGGLAFTLFLWASAGPAAAGPVINTEQRAVRVVGLDGVPLAAHVAPGDWIPIGPGLDWCYTDGEALTFTKRGASVSASSVFLTLASGWDNLWAFRWPENYRLKSLRRLWLGTW